MRLRTVFITHDFDEDNLSRFVLQPSTRPCQVKSIVFTGSFQLVDIDQACILNSPRTRRSVTFIKFCEYRMCQNVVTPAIVIIDI